MDTSIKKLESLRLNAENSSLIFSNEEPNYVFPSFYVNVFDELNCAQLNDDNEHIKNLIDEYKKVEEVCILLFVLIFKNVFKLLSTLNRDFLVEKWLWF